MKFFTLNISVHFIRYSANWFYSLSQLHAYSLTLQGAEFSRKVVAANMTFHSGTFACQVCEPTCLSIFFFIFQCLWDTEKYIKANLFIMTTFWPDLLWQKLQKCHEVKSAFKKRICVPSIFKTNKKTLKTYTGFKLDLDFGLAI